MLVVVATCRGRECVVPEVSRTKHIGDTGANVNAQSAKQFHDMAWARRRPKPRGQLTFGDLFYLMQQVRCPALLHDAKALSRDTRPMLVPLVRACARTTSA